ncbi:MAG: hypothetical protein WAM53_19085 [Terrimicrobiaceae bacterium]
MFLLQQLLPGMLAAVLVSGVFAIVGRLWRANNWADAVALGIGYASGHAVAVGWPAFPPSEATQWLPYFALAAAVLGVLDVFVRPAGSLRALIWVACCAGLLGLLLKPKFQYGWSIPAGVLWVAGLAAGMLVLASSLDAAVRRDSSISSPLVLTIVTCGTGATLMLSGSMLLGQLAMVLAAALGATLVVAFLLPKAVEGRGVVPVSVALLVSLWLCGCFYADLPVASALLLAVAPFPAFLLIAISEKKLLTWKDLLLRAGVVAVPVAISVLIAFRASPPLDY